MMIDLVHCSINELKVKKSRTVFTLIAIFISFNFIVSFIGAGNGIRNFLFRDIETMAKPKLITLYNSNSGIKQKDIEWISNKTNAKDIKIFLEYDVLAFEWETDLLQAKGPINIKFYSREFPLVTKSELKENILKHGEDLNYLNGEVDGVYVNEGYLRKKGIVDKKDLMNSMVMVTIRDSNNEIIEIKLPIIDVIPTYLFEGVDNINSGDIFISSKLINIEEPVIEYVVIDYETHTKVRKIKQELSSYGFNVIYNHDAVLNAETESIVYNTILFTGGLVIILVTCFTLFNTLNISFKERMKFYGMLKAIGFRNIHIYTICILQGVILILIGGMLGILSSFITSKFIGTYLAMSLITEAANNIQTDVFTLEISSILYSLFLLIISGIISSIIAVFSSVRINIVKVLSVEK